MDKKIRMMNNIKYLKDAPMSIKFIYLWKNRNSKSELYNITNITNIHYTYYNRIKKSMK